MPPLKLGCSHCDPPLSLLLVLWPDEFCGMPQHALSTRQRTLATRLSSAATTSLVSACLLPGSPEGKGRGSRRGPHAAWLHHCPPPRRPAETWLSRRTTTSPCSASTCATRRCATSCWWAAPTLRRSCARCSRGWTSSWERRVGCAAAPLRLVGWLAGWFRGTAMLACCPGGPCAGYGGLGSVTPCADRVGRMGLCVVLLLVSPGDWPGAATRACAAPVPLLPSWHGAAPVALPSCKALLAGCLHVCGPQGA